MGNWKYAAETVSNEIVFEGWNHWLKHLALLQLHILTVPASISRTYHGYATTGKHAGSSLHFSMAKNDARVAEIAEIVQLNYS